MKLAGKNKKKDITPQPILEDASVSKPPPEKWPSLILNKPLRLPDKIKRHYVDAKKKKSPAKFEIVVDKPVPKERSKPPIPKRPVMPKKSRPPGGVKMPAEKYLQRKEGKGPRATPVKLKKPAKAKKKTNTVGTGFMQPPYKDTVKGTRPYAKRQGYHGYKNFKSNIKK